MSRGKIFITFTEDAISAFYKEALKQPFFEFMELASKDHSDDCRPDVMRYFLVKGLLAAESNRNSIQELMTKADKNARIFQGENQRITFRHTTKLFTRMESVFEDESWQNSINNLELGGVLSNRGPKSWPKILVFIGFSSI